MKKLLLALVLVPMMGLAEEEWVNGYCWSYTISNGKAEIIPGSHGAKGSVPASAGKSGADVSASSSASTGQTATPSTPRNVIYIPSVLGGSPVTRIGDSAFCNCAWMKDDVVIPDSVTSIGQSAFDSCCEMMSVAIPSSVTEIGVNAFFACRKLEKVYVEKGDAARIKTMLRGVNVNALTFVEEQIDAAAVTRDSVMSDWFSGLKSRKSLTLLSVGNERIWVDDVALPYRFSNSGAVLQATLGGYRLDLSGVAITGSHWSSGNCGIWADGDIAVFLQGQNTIIVESRSSKTGIYSQGGVLIFGGGSLSINSASGEHYGTGIGGSQNVTIGGGASVTITGAGKGIDTWDGDILLDLCTVGIYGIDYGAMHSHKGSISILGSAVSLIAGDGFTVGKGIVIDGSLVDMYVNGEGMNAKSFGATHSYLACVATGDHALFSVYEAFTSHEREAVFDNCVVRFASAKSQCMNADVVILGEGDYAFATSMDAGSVPFAAHRSEFQAAAILATDVNVCGANLLLCAPETKGVFAKDVFRMESGRIEVVRHVDIHGMLLFDSALAAAYGITSSQIGFSSWSENFYGQVMNDVATSLQLTSFDGETLAGIFAPYNCTQSGGTIWCDNAKWGIVSSNPIVDGGSYNGMFYTADFSSGEVAEIDFPLSSAGDSLAGEICSVGEKKKYDKVEQSWTGILPAYYGTKSLYADEGGKLYFWLPEAWRGLNDKVATVLFDACYGITPEKVRIVSKGRTIGALPTPTREGFTFLGWFTAANDGSEVLASQMVVGDVTYYAHWAKSVAPYKLTFVANGGMGTSIPPIQMEANRVYKLPKCKLTPPDNKKRFAGWAGSNGKQYDDEMLVFNLGDVTMTAIWE